MLVHSCIEGSSVVKLVESIEQGIRNGDLSAGEKLPAIRLLAIELKVSPATVSGAYRRLQERGFIVSRGRGGTVVSARPPVSVGAPLLVDEDVVDLATGNPDPKLLPKLAPALASVRRSQRLYDEAPCLPALVELGVAAYRNDGIIADRVCVVNGSLDGIERALSECLYPGDRVAVEDPCFNGVLDLVRARGLVPVPVDMDQHGILPEALKQAMKLKPKALIVTPRAQNPTGAAFTPARVEALRSVLNEMPSLFVIEDDYFGDLSGVPYHGLCDALRQRWTVVRSLCKSMGPDLRIALLAGDDQTLSNIQGRQIIGIRWVSHILQDLAVHFLSDKETSRRLERAKNVYCRRREALVGALRDLEIEAFGQSGFNVWVPVSEEAGVTQNLHRAGWLVTPGERYRIQSPPAIRVTTSSLPESQAPALAAAIRDAIRGAPVRGGGV